MAISGRLRRLLVRIRRDGLKGRLFSSLMRGRPAAFGVYALGKTHFALTNSTLRIEQGIQASRIFEAALRQVSRAIFIVMRIKVTRLVLPPSPRVSFPAL